MRLAAPAVRTFIPSFTVHRRFLSAPTSRGLMSASDVLIVSIQRPIWSGRTDIREENALQSSLEVGAHQVDAESAVLRRCHACRNRTSGRLPRRKKLMPDAPMSDTPACSGQSLDSCRSRSSIAAHGCARDSPRVTAADAIEFVTAWHACGRRRRPDGPHHTGCQYRRSVASCSPGVGRASAVQLVVS